MKVLFEDKSYDVVVPEGVNEGQGFRVTLPASAGSLGSLTPAAIAAAEASAQAKGAEAPAAAAPISQSESQ